MAVNSNSFLEAVVSRRHDNTKRCRKMKITLYNEFSPSDTVEACRFIRTALWQRYARIYCRTRTSNHTRQGYCVSVTAWTTMTSITEKTWTSSRIDLAWSTIKKKRNALDPSRQFIEICRVSTSRDDSPRLITILQIFPMDNVVIGRSIYRVTNFPRKLSCKINFIDSVHAFSFSI